MRRRRSESIDAPGQDSFLDIVANLVGILIILIMVIGVRAKDAMLEAAPLLAADEQEEPEELDVATAQAAARSVEAGIHEMTSKLGRQQLEIEYRRKEREKIQLLLAAADAALAEKRDELNVEQQSQFDLQRDLLAAGDELQGLDQSIQVAEGSIAKTAVIDHLPTPIAKTVFGKEIHFRLLGGKVAFVPLDEFADKLKTDAPQKLWRLKENDSFTETIGPINGFLMKYRVARTRHATATRVGTAIQTQIELDHFKLIPVEDNLGEPLADALREGSQFLSLLAANDPETTTITVWTYPDSFNEFRTVKQELFRRGFLTASRPLPNGAHIQGSPHGTRSSAQ